MYACLSEQAVREQKKNLGYKLVHANKVFFDRTLPLDKCMTLLLNTELGAVDFGSGGGEKARNEINRYFVRNAIIDV